MEERCFAAEARIPKYLTKWKRGAGTRAASFSTNSLPLMITCVVPFAPGCFHPIREAAAGKTLQTLDSEWGPQHLAAQILQLCTLMGRQAHIRMNAESIDIGATPSGGFRLFRFSAAAPGADAFPGVRPVAMRPRTPWAYNPASHGVSRISGSSASPSFDAPIPFFLHSACVRRDTVSATAATSGSSGARKG